MTTSADIIDFCQALNGGVLVEGSEACRAGGWGWLSGTQRITFPECYIKSVNWGYYVSSGENQTGDAFLWVCVNGVWTQYAHLSSHDGVGNASATNVSVAIGKNCTGLYAYGTAWNGGVGYSSCIQAWGYKYSYGFLL